MSIPGPLLEASAAGRQNELWPVLLGEQSPPGVFALSSQFGKLHQIIELLVHVLGATHQLQVLSCLHSMHNSSWKHGQFGHGEAASECFCMFTDCTDY